ncbi:glycosyltransferase [Gammaproteobacteria bacterium]|jgi:GT2 family glycosyltransferase|nr:glycosyltransferase [Gammaproteobacteria bacterium]
MSFEAHMHGISFVIVCYKSQLDLPSLVASIFQHTDIPHELIEIIIVDNWGAGEEQRITNEMSKNYDSSFIYKKSDKNGGYGAGNNIGIMSAKHDIVCVVNPDVRFITPIFKKVLTKFAYDSNLLALSGEQISKTRNSFFIRPEFQHPLFKELASRLLTHVGIFSHRFMALSGAMTFYRKSLFLDIGLFDERIFLYGEESDVSLRALRSGYKLGFFPEFKYLHLDWDLVGPSPDNIKYLTSSVFYYQDKHNVSCHGYFMAGKVHFSIKYVFFLLLGRKADAHESKSLIAMYSSKKIKK